MICSVLQLPMQGLTMAACVQWSFTLCNPESRRGCESKPVTIAFPDVASADRCATPHNSLLPRCRLLALQHAQAAGLDMTQAGVVCRWHATMTEAVCVFQQRMHPDASGQSVSLTMADRGSLAMTASAPLS